MTDIKLPCRKSFQDTDIFLVENSSCSRQSRSQVPENHSGMSATNHVHAKGGFIALFTAIIISIVLLLVSVSLNRGGYLTRGEALDAEYKNRSLALAEACAQKAMFSLAYDPTYTGVEPSVAVGSDTCSIGAISFAGSQYTINTGAVFPATSVAGQGAVTRLQVVVNSADFSLVSWEEIP